MNQIFTNFIKKKLYLKFIHKNNHQIPKVVKIVISCGTGVSSDKIFKDYIENITLISGQYPRITRAKKAISNFKIRKDMPVGLMITLRKKKMYSFLEKLLRLVLPKMRNFNGFDKNSFDKFGNLSIGISDFSLFPETQDSISNTKFGFNITIVASARSRNENIFFFKELGLPIINKN